MAGSDILLLYPRSSDKRPFIQVNFWEPKTISGVITTGNGRKPEWVTGYQVYTSFDGKTFSPYSDKINSAVPKNFSANTDQTTEVPNLFNRNIYGQYVRIYPTTYHGAVSMNFEILGCNPSVPLPGSNISVTTTESTVKHSSTTPGQGTGSQTTSKPTTPKFGQTFAPPFPGFQAPSLGKILRLETLVLILII